MANYRNVRVNEATMKALSVIVREVKDPRISDNFVSITGAEVSPDLKYAKIYWSTLVSGAEKEKEISQGLKSAKGFLRKRLAEELDLRQTPELSFCVDRSAANSAHISALLRSIGEGEK
jgi:ribosome-binding factor A